MTRAGAYNPVRGDKVIAFAKNFLDEHFPLSHGSYNDVSSFSLVDNSLSMRTVSGELNSLKDFYKIIQQDPNNVIALTGMGVNFGNLGEYKEASNYLESALKEDPDNKIIKNYKKIIDEINIKYRYTPTEKPVSTAVKNNGEVPIWVKNTVSWWGIEKITDDDFLRYWNI